MSDSMMSLRAHLEKSPGADMRREMIGFAAGRLMELDIGACMGIVCGEVSRDRLAQRISADAQQDSRLSLSLETRRNAIGISLAAVTSGGRLALIGLVPPRHSLQNPQHLV